MASRPKPQRLAKLTCAQIDQSDLRYLVRRSRHDRNLLGGYPAVAAIRSNRGRRSFTPYD